MKLTKISDKKNGFYRCMLKAKYYTDLSMTETILPMKNGYLFNPEYQHTVIILRRKLSIIDDYYEIKKMLRKIFADKSNSYDFNYYKIN